MRGRDGVLEGGRSKRYTNCDNLATCVRLVIVVTCPILTHPPPRGREGGCETMKHLPCPHTRTHIEYVLLWLGNHQRDRTQQSIGEVRTA